MTSRLFGDLKTLFLVLICSLVVALILIGCALSTRKQQRKDLASAVQHRDVAEVQQLLEAGVDPDKASTSGGFFNAPFGGSPILHVAVESESVEILKLLFKHGANANRTDPSGRVALHVALPYRVSHDVVRLLLDNGADVNARTSRGETALDIAVSGGYGDTATLLRSYGAKHGKQRPTGPIAERTVEGVAPKLISPQPGATLPNGRRDHSVNCVWEFDWSDCPGASVYHLRVTAQGARKPLIDKSGIAASHWNHVSTGYVIDQNRSRWVWEVRARVNGAWGPWSTQRELDVAPLR